MPNLRQAMMGAAGVSSSEAQLWVWGPGYDGRLGTGNTTNLSSPVQLGALTDWAQVGGFNRGGLAVKTDGTLWTWGDNDYGQLGDGTTTDRSSPAQVGSLTDWFMADGGEEHCMAIKTDGTLWSWGRNTVGQLGLGDTTNRSSPVQVGSLTDWLATTSDDLLAGTPVKFSPVFDTNAIIKNDGTLWTWGEGGGGVLGNGSQTDISSPVQVGSLTDWLSVSPPSDGDANCAALKTDGTLWTWGANGNGSLGLGDTTNRSSPVQVGALTTWKYIATPTNGTQAVKTDGTLWSWGGNYQGQLGDGTTTSRSSPVQVGSLTNWKTIHGSSRVMRTVKTDGTLWCWGMNAYGSVGDGTTVNKSSPVQVGSDTTWGNLIRPTGGSFSLTIRYI